MKFLKSGPGFGGSCFTKDILNLIYLCNFYGLEEVADYWDQVLKINDWQKRRITHIISEKLFGNISRKKITISEYENLHRRKVSSNINNNKGVIKLVEINNGEFTEGLRSYLKY